MNEYGTLSKLRTFLSLASAETSDDTLLEDLLTKASKSIDRYCRRHFFPKRYQGTNTRKYDLPEGDCLVFDEIDVLDVHGLSHLNGATEIDESVYWLKAGDNWNLTPFDRIQLDDSSGSIFNFSGTPQRAVHVDLVAGYHEDYGNAWVNSGGSLTSALGSAVTLASVSASGGVNSIGISPRFSKNQIWRLGSGASEEFAYVQDTTDGDSVRLIRGINGTSAVNHAASTQVYVWQPEHDIEYSALELSAFVYQKARSPFTNKISVLQLGVVETPQAWPEITLDRLSRYQRSLIHSK